MRERRAVQLTGPRSWRDWGDRQRQPSGQSIYLPHRNILRRNNSYKWMEGSLTVSSSSSTSSASTWQSLSKLYKMLDEYHKRRQSCSSSSSEEIETIPR